MLAPTSCLRKMDVKRRGRSSSDVVALAAGGALGAHGERLRKAQDVPQPWRPWRQAQRLVALWQTRIPMHHGFVPNTLLGVHDNSQYFCDAARGMWTASRTTMMASKTSTTWRTSTMGGSSCSVMASPRVCNTMTWRGARYSPKIACLFAGLIHFWTSHCMCNASCKQVDSSLLLPFVYTFTSKALAVIHSKNPKLYMHTCYQLEPQPTERALIYLAPHQLPFRRRAMGVP